MGNNATNLGGLEVDDHDHILANEISRFIMLGDTGDDLALLVPRSTVSFRSFSVLGTGSAARTLTTRR